MKFDDWLAQHMTVDEIAEMRAEVAEQMKQEAPRIKAKLKAKRRYRYPNREFINFKSYQAYKGNTRRFHEAYRMKNPKRGKRVTQSLIALW